VIEDMHHESIISRHKHRSLGDVEDGDDDQDEERTYLEKTWDVIRPCPKRDRACGAAGFKDTCCEGFLHITKSNKQGLTLVHIFCST
jgi:hypothetical protein